MKKKKSYKKPECEVFLPSTGDLCLVVNSNGLVVNSNEESGLPYMGVRGDQIDFEDWDGEDQESANW